MYKVAIPARNFSRSKGNLSANYCKSHLTYSSDLLLSKRCPDIVHFPTCTTSFRKCSDSSTLLESYIPGIFLQEHNASHSIYKANLQLGSLG